MKNKKIIPIIIAILIFATGILNITLWYLDKMSIYGLVYGVMSLILAWFVFHFGRR